MLQPDYLLLDEVTSAIDPPTIKEVTAALYRLRARMVGNEQTIVLVTHLLSFAFDFADMMIFLHDGVVYEEGVGATSKHQQAPGNKRVPAGDFLMAGFWPISGDFSSKPTA